MEEKKIDGPTICLPSPFSPDSRNRMFQVRKRMAILARKQPLLAKRPARTAMVVGGRVEERSNRSARLGGRGLLSALLCRVIEIQL